MVTMSYPRALLPAVQLTVGLAFGIALSALLVTLAGCDPHRQPSALPPDIELPPGDLPTEGEGEPGEGEGEPDEGEGEPDRDDDFDGLDDDLEDQLARDYLPFLSNHPDDGCPRSGIVFRARPHPLDDSFVHVIYSRLYEFDCGFTRHAGDNEVFAITIDPTRAAPAGIVAMRGVSHQNTVCQRDTMCGACNGLRACDTTTRNGALGGTAGWPVVYSSKDKHASAVDVHEGCSLDASCLDVCTLANAPALLPLVNAGEPGHPFVDNLSDAAQGGFITTDNGWTEPSEIAYDPWGGADFGEAGVVSEDLIDAAFDTPVCRPTGTDDPPEDDDEPFVLAPDFVTEERLCDIPANADDVVDPVNLPCALEVRNIDAPAALPPGDDVRVVAWNVEFGASQAVVLDQLLSNPELAGADVLLLSEVARMNGESVPVGIHQVRELADALGMAYAFGVEWDRRFNPDVPAPKGEHGIAVLSRFPLGNLTPIRHTPANDFWDERGDIGGRITLGATVLVPTTSGGVQLRVYASHLCTRPQFPSDDARAVQGAEIRADAARPGRPALQVVGGDLNTWTCNPANSDCTSSPDAEEVVVDFLNDGWDDGTRGFNGFTQLGEGFFPQRLDWLFVRGAALLPGTAVTDADGSDHLPLFTDVLLP